MNDAFKYNAFISYSHAGDLKFAPALQDALQNFAKPWYKRRNLEIFRDETTMSASPHLWENIKQALDQSEYLILLASPISEKSTYIDREVEYWLKSKPVDTILIAITEGQFEWDNDNNCFLDPANNLLPPALDGKFDSEPFYIDLRQSKTEKFLTLSNPIFKKEILKIAARLHGVRPNDLASEEVRVHRKMMLLRNGIVAVLILLLMGAIIATVSAYRNGVKAEANRVIAEDKTLRANKALGDFKDLKSTSIGAEYQGGIIFHWSDKTGKNGLVASKTDLPGVYTWEQAKDECNKLSRDGYTDWYLPTREEISTLYANRYVIGGFQKGYYWSLSAYRGDNKRAFFQSFVHGDLVTAGRSKTMHVRPVRKFYKK
jgi:hypothetical protein